MPSYDCEQDIPSCFVSKELIDEIESYIIMRATDLNKSSGNSKFDYKFKIIDSAGTESFDSSKDYNRSTLPNDIVCAVFYFRQYSSPVSLIEVRLGKEKYSSNISITTDGFSAKENAVGITNEIQRRISQHKNINFIFHGKFSAIPYAVLGLITGMAFQAPIKSNFSNLFPLAALIFSGIIFLAIYYALKWSSPYCVFETPKNLEIARWRKWILNGAIGTAIFGGFSKFLWGQ